MKVKAILLALLSGFVFSAAAQEYQPQVGFSTEKGYKTNFKKNKAGDNWFISIALLLNSHSVNGSTRIWDSEHS